MANKTSSFSARQILYQELVIGTLIYTVVLGFFSDYSSFVSANSFSTIFFASIVLEVLTYLAFRLKGLIVTRLKDRKGNLYRLLMFFCVWLVMFVSKFVFIWVLDLLFGSYINIIGFFGILLVVLCVTIIHRLTYKLFKSLA